MERAAATDPVRALGTRWHSYRLPRPLNPVAWWAFALGLAAAAALTTNPLLTALLIGVATVVVLARRGDGPWARSFRLYVLLGLLIVVVRVLYRLVFGGGDGQTVLFVLPQVPLPDWVSGIRLFGPVSAEALLGGLQDGLRLACIVICVGAANSLANPKRLLAQLPNALYELGAVLVVAVSVFAQLADSIQRVRRARNLRVTAAGASRHPVRDVVVPVITDALDRSMALASSMEVRGYGRTTGATAIRRLSTGLVLTAMILLCLGAYAALSGAAPLSAGRFALPLWPVPFGLAVVCAVIGLRLNGRTVSRTRYRPDRWGAAEIAVIICGLAPFWVFSGVGSSGQASLLVPAAGQWPQVSPVLLIGPAIALLPAVLTPPPVTGVGEADRERDLIMDPSGGLS